MDRKMYKWISGLVTDKPDQSSSRPISQLGQQVQSEYQCGYISNKHLIFSVEDKHRLRQQIITELNVDPFTTQQLPTSRLEMAKFHANEKLASKSAGHDHLLLNCADGILRINNIQIPLHSQSVASAGLLCLNSSLRSIEHQTIVVIENLSIMSLCHRWQLPQEIQQALWVYRGDYKSGASVQVCHDFLEHFGADKTIVVFSDMDPKGLEIALSLPFAKFWIGPTTHSWRSLLNNHVANRTGFDTQTKAMNYLLQQLASTELSAAFVNLITVIREERSSFRQEHLYSHNVGLELIPIYAENHN